MSNLIIQDLSEVEQLIDAPSAPGAAPLAPSRRQGGVDSFVQENLQLAQRVGGRIGVEPHVLLGQWGLETGWGKSVIPGTNNLGNIKDFSGKGPSARDNMTGSVDAYKKFDTPDDFADGFSGLIERKYQTAMGAGGNSMRYFHALKKVGYAEDPNYIAKGSAAAAMAQRAMKTAGLSAASAPVQTASSRAPRYADRADSSADASQGGFISDLGTAVKQGVGMLSRNIRSSGSAALGNLSEVELLAEAQAAAAENDPQAKKALMAEIQLRKEANPESKVLTAITDVLGAAVANPEGTLQLVAEQAPNTLVTLGGGWAGAKAGAVAGGALGSVVPVVGTAAGAAAGGILGFLGGMFLGNALIETGAKAMEKAVDAEGFTEQDRQDALREGATKAGVITAVDALTFKLGGAAAKFINRSAIQAGARAEVKVLADAGVDISNGQSIARALAADSSLRQAATKAGQDAASAAASLTQRAATAGGVVGMETLGEGGGEYLGELAADGEADPYDAAIEALASFTQSAPQAAASMTSSQGNDMSVRGMLKVKADAGGVLSRAALAGLPEDAADEVPAGAPVDPISARAIEIETQVRNEGLLEQLRNIGQPGRTTTEFLDALAVAKNPKMDPVVRQQAVESLDMAMGWIRDGAMPGDAAIVQEESVDEAPIPADAADNIAAADIGGVIEPAAEPKARRLVDLPKVATPAGNAPASQRREMTQIQAAVEAGFDTVERRADGVYLVHSGKNQESKLSGLGAMARARKLIADATDARAHASASSPLNDLEQPTEAQAKAGNYKKGAARLNGFAISIENPRESVRSGTAPDGTKWESKMAHHYGYFRRTTGADNDQVDVFIGPRPDLDTVYVVDQIDGETGEFDEHKVMMGFKSIEDARAGYLANYEKGWQGLGAITEMPLSVFRKWVRSDAARKPASQYDPSSTTGESNGRDDAGAAGAGVGEQLHGDDGGRQGLGEADEGGEGGSRQHQNTGATGRAGRAAAQQGDRVADSARRDRSEEDVAIRDLAAAAAKQGRRVKIDAADPGDHRVQAAHNLFDAFERLTGHRAIPVVATGLHAFDGVQHGKYTFVNIDRPVQSLAWTIGHEFKHLSERLPGLAKLYNRIWDLIPVSAKAKYLVYLHETNQASTDQLSQATPDDLALLKEEMVADFMGQRFNDKAWLQQLAHQKPALFGDFVRDWVKALNALIGHLQAMLGRNGGSGNATKDIDALMAGYIAQLEEAKQIAFEVAVAWAERHPKLAKEADVAARTDGVQLSARAETVKVYEDRIDAIFAGDQANRIGARILDRSDMLDMLGLGDQPILIAEGKVIAGMDNHPRMTADVWKKIPGWLDNPAAVFDSDTVDGRLVFIAPELLNGLPVRMIVEASPELDGLSVSLMVNAYDAPGRAPWMRWAESGLTRYIDKKKLPAILAPSGLQLTRVEQEARGAGRILTEKNLSGYRRSAGDAKFSARDEFPSLDPDFLDGELEALLQAELEAELDGNGSATQMPAAADLRDAGLLAEDAFQELSWQDEGATGYQLTTRIPDLYREGKTARIDMEQAGGDGLWRADMPTTWFGPGADEADGYAPMQDVQDFVRRQVAAVTLHKNGFDLLSAAPKAAVRKAVDGWKTASELDNVRAYKRPSAKATTLKDIAHEMGLDEKYDVSIVIDTPYPGQTVYNIGFNSKTSEKRYGALLTLISDDGPKRLEVNTIELGRSGMGGAVYQLVSEFAARRNIPLHAESSVSAVNSYRRTEQMLSAALRTGKSNAMVPHKTQRVYGFNDKATTIEQHDDNLSRLVLATLRNAFELAPEVMDLQYHPQTGLFTLADGSDAERLVSEILSRVETRALGLGRSQLARAAMTREMMAGKLKADQIESFAAPVLYSAREALAAEYQAVVDQHMGKPSWMKAPNGQATKLTERQWVQVRTESFKKWFGDWESFATKEGGVWTDGDGAVSKAVHKDTGEPLVVYHGTDKGGFMAFKSAGGQQRGDLGIFTTDNYDMARSYVRRGRVQDVMAPTSRDELEEAGFQFEEGFSIQEKFYPDMESAEEDRDDGDEIVPSVRVTDVDGYDLDGPRETHYRFTSLDQAVAAAAESFGGSENISTVYATFINLRNPNESDFEGALWSGSRDHQWVVEVGGEIQSDSDGTMYFNSQEEARDFAQTFLSEDDEDADPYDYVRGADEHYSTSDDEVREGRRYGNDGTIIRNVIDDGGGSGPYAHEPSDVFVAFKPGQVKSAEWNTGEFGDVDDLRYSKRTQDAAAGDKTDVAQLPAGKPIPASVATGSLEQSLAVARSGSYRRGRELKADLQQRVLAAADQEGVDLSERTQANHQFLADMVRADAEFALKSNQNAVGWYDTKVSRALGALATVHPEIESNPKARLAFLWALATTSNGLKVNKNFELAERAYQAWKTTGTMPGDVGIGNAAGAINKSLLMFNHLVEKVGGERLAKFMSTEFGAGEIERMLGVAVGGEWKSTPVRGAAILGPKIGNGFFSNLNGYFNSLTMDRWLMRTWGRLTGTLLQVDPKMVKASRAKLASSITAMDDAQRRTMSRLIGVLVKRRMTVAEIDAAATAIQKASMKVNVREQMMAAPAMDRVRRDGNGHHKYLDGQKEAPANPGERNWIRAVFQTALDNLRESGVGMTMSDLQALLWYPERRLYDAAKSDEDVADGYEDDEAPDYANAAMALALDNGVDLKTVVAAMDQAEKRGTVRGETLSAEERAAMLKEFRSAPKQGTQLAFEVAPDPADNAAVDAWGQLTTQERTKVTDTVRKAVVDDIATLVGVPVQKVAPATGGYAGLVNPSLIAEYQKTKVSLAHARSLASAIGYVLDQDSVALVDPRVESKNGLIRITFSGKVEPHANAIYQAIHAAVPEVDAFTARGNNFDILNFTDLSNEELNDLVVNALEASDIPLEAVTSFGDVHSELVEKASYESHIQGARPGSGSEVRTGVDWLRDRARKAVSEGIREALDARRARRAAAARLADGAGRAAAKREGQPVNQAAQDWNNDTRFSARTEASPEFQAWSSGLEVIEDGFYTGGPAVFRAYHGTTHNGITEFSRTGDKGGFLGQGPYFTTSPDDASINYAGIGPDLKSRIGVAVDDIGQSVGDDKAYAEDVLRDYFDATGIEQEITKENIDGLLEQYGDTAIEHAATSQLKGDSDGLVMPAYVRLANPADTVHGTLDYNLVENDDGDVIDETGSLVDWVLTARAVGERYDIGRDMESYIDAMLADGDGARMADALSLANKHLTYATDDSGEMISAGHVFSEIAEEAGYDGIVMDAGFHFGPSRRGFGGARIPGMPGVGDGTMHIVPFSAAQVKSAIGNSGAFSAESNDIRQSARTPGELFFSELSAQVEKSTMKQAPAAAWKTYIKALSSKGVKADEIEWTGVNDWLDLQTGKVPKEALLGYLDANGVQVEEVVLGDQSLTPEQRAELRRLEALGEDELDDRSFNRLQDLTDRSDSPEQSTKYGNYTLPGGENYREVLLTLPVKVGRVDDETARRLGAEKGWDTDAPLYRSSHWNQGNVLAHIRVNDRTDADGRKILFVEEIQSDWGQDGKKKGFVGSNPGLTTEQDHAIREHFGRLVQERPRIFQATTDVNRMMVGMGTAEMEAALTIAGLDASIADGLHPTSGAIPVAPFVSNTQGWLNLALKRVIGMAVDGGYDAVAFVNGEQSAERYDLSKQIDRIDYADNGDGSYDLSAIKDGSEVFSEEGISLDRIEEVVGKDIAAKVQAGDGKAAGKVDRWESEDVKPAQMKSLSGLDLKVGGEGMKSFYDKIVPNAVKAMSKKLGGEVSGVRVQTSESVSGGKRFTYSTLTDLNGKHYVVSKETGDKVAGPFDAWQDASAWLGRNDPALVTEQPGLLITDAIREKLSGGMPLFSARDLEAAEKAGFDASKTWYHGTVAKDFKGFKAGKGGINELGSGIYVTDQPMYAEAWAGRPSDGGRIIPVVLKKGDIFDSTGIAQAWRGVKGEQMAKWFVPLAKRLKANNEALSTEASMTDSGEDLWRTWLGVSNHELAAHIMETVGRGGNLNTWLDRAGYIGMRNENSQIPGQVVVFRPQYLRSPWAKFNPKKADSGNLLYSARDVKINDHSKWSVYQERSAQVGDGFVRWIEDSDTTYVTDLQSGPKVRGRAILEWLKDSTGKQAYAVGVVDDAAGFWDRMEDDDLITGQTDEDFMTFFGLRPKYSARDPQTETEAFKAWFDGSKVVTASGDPQVVYHGTDGDFTEFDAGKSGKNYRSTGGQRGIFFTSSPSTASVYAEQPAGAVLNPGNPDGADFGDGTANIMPVYLSLQNPLIVSSTKSPDKYFDYNRDSIYARADKAGADGIIVRGKGAIKRDLFVAFKSSQVKSAIGNDGGFGGGGDIRYSIRNGNSLWDEPTASRFDDFVYKAQDKLIDLKRVVQSIKKSTGAIADDINAYLQEELFHGRAAKRAHDFGTQELTPLMEQLAADGLTIGDIEEYLHARHANEANRVIADRNPGVPGLQDGGSGMKDADADAYFANLPAALRTKLQAAAAKVDAINDKTRQLYVDYGLESQDTVDSWKSLFKHYIPLQREDKDGRGGMGIGQGFSVKGKETRGRTGSTRKVVDILANIAMQRERLIVRGEKNRVAAALVGLAAANPNPDFWSVGAPPAERVYDPNTNTVVDRVDPMYKSRDNVVVAKLSYPNGDVREMAVVFNEDDPRALRMAQAMKNLDAGNLEGILGVSAKITRYFSSINTQYNPVFGVVNLVRDVQGAMLNLGDTPLAGKRVRIARDTLSALRAIYGDLRAERRGGQATSPWAALWEEFVDQGGKTGYRELFRTSKDRADALQGILTPDAWMDSKLGKIFTANGTLKVPMSQAKKGADWIFSWLSDYNEAMENGVRLAAYKSALDKGMSKRQAASLAKNLTVNFNRKGQMGMQAGAVYAFFNAAMQGSARIGQTVFDMDGNDIKSIRLSKTGKQVVYGGILLGAIQAVALAWAGFDDEDPPEFVRERSLVIPIGDKKYLSIPMPLGFHVIPGIGRHAVEFALSGFEKPAERMVTMLGMFADGFNPIGNAGLSMQTLAPTALDPLVALTENRDWTGKPIARTSMNKAIPGHALHKDTASTLAKLMAEAVNAATGGNEYVAGAMSPTPDQIDYLIGQVTGGVGRELSKVEQTGLGVVRGENVPIFKMPLVGRFIGDAGSQSSEGTAFYSNVAKLNELETEIKGLQGDGRAAEAQQLRAGRPDAYLIAVANTAERQVQRLRREKRALIEAGAPRERVKAIEESITQAMARLNRAAEKVKQ